MDEEGKGGGREVGKGRGREGGIEEEGEGKRGKEGREEGKGGNVGKGLTSLVLPPEHPTSETDHINILY